MNRSVFSCRCLAISLVLSMLVARPVIAAEPVLSQIPADALGVGLLNNLGQASRDVDALARKLGIDAPNLLGQAQEANAAKGIDETGTLAVALFADSAAAPLSFDVWPLIYVPVADYAAFIKQFEPDDPNAKIVTISIAFQEWLVGRRGDYAVLAQSGDRERLEKALAAEKAAAASLEGAAEWAAGQRAAVVVGRNGIEYAMTQAIGGIAMARAMFADPNIPEQQRATMDAALGMYEQLFRLISREVTQFAAGARIDEAVNVYVASLTQVRKEGDVGKMLAGVKPPRRHPLAGLPAEPFVLAGGGDLPAAFAAAMGDLFKTSIRMYPGGEKLTREQVDELAEAYAASMKPAASMSILMGVGKPGDSLYANMYLLMGTDDSTQFIPDYAKAMQKLAEFAKQVDVPVLAGFSVERRRYADKPGLKVSIKWPPGAFGPADTEEFRKLLMGDAESLDMFMAAATDDSVVGVYVSEANLRKAMAAATDRGKSLAADPEIAAIDKLLPADSQWRLYVQPRESLQWIANLAGAFAPGGPPPLPELPDTPPVAVAVKGSAAGLETVLVVPAELLEAGGKLARGE